MVIKEKIIMFCLAAVGAGFVVLQTLVYNGYCVSKGGWSNEAELYDTALRSVYDAYPPQRFRVPGVFSKKIINHVQYAGFEDFVARNPDCCSLSETGWKGMRVGFFHKLRGYSGGFVRVEYVADADEIGSAGKTRITETVSFLESLGKKYTPNKGNLSFVPMTNCGKVWQGY